MGYEGITIGGWIDPCKEIFFECIIQKSEFVQKFDIHDFYTHEGQPKDYMKQVLADFRNSEHCKYKGRDFYVNNGVTGICYVFYNGFVYNCENYYNGCPILANIIREFISFKK